jgi:WD40 repeat protein
MAPTEPDVERVESLGGGSKKVAPKYTCNPGYGDQSAPADNSMQGLRSSGCFCVRFSPDDQYLAASFSNGAIHVYNAETGSEEFVLNRPGEKESLTLPTTQLRWRPHTAQSKTKNVLISVNADNDGKVLHWHIKSGKCLHTITEPHNQIFCLDYFIDGSLFATAGKDRLVRVYDEATKRMVQTLSGGDQKECAGHSNRVFSLKFHPQQPNVILSGGWDNTVQLWDLRKGHSVRSFWNCYLCGDAVDISSDGNQLLTGSWRIQDCLQVWDFGTGELVESVPWTGYNPSAPKGGAPGSMLFTAQFSRDPASQLIIAGGTQGNEAKIFDRSAGRAEPVGVLTGLAKPVFGADFDQKASKAAVGGADGIVRVLSVQ